jgi:hypothetical protein
MTMPPEMQEITRCRVCGSTALTRVLDLGRQSLTGRFPRPQDPDPMAGPLELALCSGQAEGSCGLLQLRHSYPPVEMYGPTYGYRSSNNQTMVAHLRAKITNLVRIARPRAGDRVLDIGSNDGTTLKLYDGMGLERYGMDPSAARYAAEYPEGARLIVDFFSAERLRREAGDVRFRIITSIAMFYDLENPLAFMRDVGSLLDADGVWELEQSYMPLMLERCAYDSVCHEHISYFRLRQIKWMADAAGLKIVDIGMNDINGGSFSVVIARKDSAHAEATAQIAALLERERRDGYDTPAPYEKFAAAVAAHRVALRAFLVAARAENKLVIGYGASTKGNVVLQYCGIGPAELPFIAEKYPFKFGLVTPGSRIPIISEVEAKAMNPAYLLVLPWYFRDEIVRREQDWIDAGGTLVFVLPVIEMAAKRAR